ncbi:putative enzyme related to lactoylglutathione lyase [Motilibacter peucedani]|uniref:Putative enzyme related to lactoylglutathione lyase n=1 Tax=Motilibacter peucedani TaxID=598650 RepID=A0A420XPL0_9ACTN|nr:VOC family protein [Motilibacter peucedani]RKS74112.1 putative enzyme related to lactoylglutathione lyase [Motilibacter peucedani]
MAVQMRTVVYPVDDLAAAKAFYTRLLGVEPHTDQPYYVGYSVDGTEIGLDPHGHAQGHTGAVAYWDVDDLEAAVASLVEAGGKVLVPAREVGGGMSVATVTDADGNLVGLRSS